MWGKPPAIDDADRAVEPLDGFEAAHRELLADRSVQFELPPFQPPPPPVNPDLGWLVDAAPVVRILFYIVIALVAAFLIYLIVSRLSGFSFRRRAQAEGAEPEWQIGEQPARQLLGDADALAAEGRYSEAAHLLLYRSIDEIDQKRPDTVRKALTSRDIAGLPALPARPAQAFASIVRAVERSLFGGRSLDASDWRDCRAAYEKFAFAQDWRA